MQGCGERTIPERYISGLGPKHKTWEKRGDKAHCDIKCFKEGLDTEVGQGDFDFMDREVIVLPYNSPNMYCGE
jgi:hypothetical protein